MLMTIVEAAPETPEQLAPYVNALLLTGEWRTAERLIRQVSDPGMREPLAALRIDHAVLCSEADAPNRPPSLTPHAQRVLQALAAWRQGNDDAANAAAAALPEDTPWRDWKALIHGLTAFDHDPSSSPGLLASARSRAGASCHRRPILGTNRQGLPRRPSPASDGGRTRQATL